MLIILITVHGIVTDSDTDTDSDTTVTVTGNINK